MVELGDIVPPTFYDDTFCFSRRYVWRKRRKKSLVHYRYDQLWCEQQTGMKKLHRACFVVSFGNVFTSMHNLPDVVLSLIFSYLPAVERTCKVSCVCRWWHSLIKSLSEVWKFVESS